MILLLIFVLKFSHRHPPHQYQQEIWVRLKLRLNLYVSEGFTNMHINIQWYTGFKRILKSLKGVCVNNCHDDNVKDLDKEQLMTIIMQTDICMVLINDMVKKNYYDDDKFSCVISDLLCKGTPPEKKNVFFRALPKLPPPPISGNLYIFFRTSKPMTEKTPIIIMTVQW